MSEKRADRTKGIKSSNRLPKNAVLLAGLFLISGIGCSKFTLSQNNKTNLSRASALALTQDESSSKYLVKPSTGADLDQMIKALSDSGVQVLTTISDGSILVRATSTKQISDSIDAGSQIELFQSDEDVALDGSGPKPLGAQRRATHQLDPSLRARAIGARTFKSGSVRSAISNTDGFLLRRLPLSQDNSLDSEFPKVGNQGSIGSCTAWSSGYYYNTYTVARDRGYNDVARGNRSHICSPSFLYSLTHMIDTSDAANPNPDGGAITAEVMNFLTSSGCASWTKMPYNGRNDYASWPSRDAWTDSMSHRMGESNYICDPVTRTCSDEDLMLIKRHLANHELLVTDFNLYSDFYDNYGDDPDNLNYKWSGFGNGVLFSAAGNFSGGHAVTIVGYDDNKIYYDDQGLEHQGAFLLVNQWGSSWGTTNVTGKGSRGFFWVAYDYFKNAGDAPEGGENSFGLAFFNTTRSNYQPRFYALLSFQHNNRYGLNFLSGLGTDALSPLSSTGDLFPVDTRQDLLPQPLSSNNLVLVDMTDSLDQISDFSSFDVFSTVKLQAGSFDNHSQWMGATYYIDLDKNGSFSSFSSDANSLQYADDTRSTLSSHFSAASCQNLAAGAKLLCSDSTVLAQLSIAIPGSNDPRNPSSASGRIDKSVVDQCNAFCRENSETGCCQMTLDSDRRHVTCQAMGSDSYSFDPGDASCGDLNNPNSPASCFAMSCHP